MRPVGTLDRRRVARVFNPQGSLISTNERVPLLRGHVERRGCKWNARRMDRSGPRGAVEYCPFNDVRVSRQRIMNERTWKPSMTVAAVIERAGRFLLVEEEAHGEIVFNQPAGHWESGESLAQACVREVMEETAHPFTPTALLGLYTWTHPRTATTFVRVAFTGDVGAPDPLRALDREIRRAVWLDLDEIRALRPRHRSPLVMACIETYLAGTRYPLTLIAEH